MSNFSINRGKKIFMQGLGTAVKRPLTAWIAGIEPTGTYSRRVSHSRTQVLPQIIGMLQE